MKDTDVPLSGNIMMLDSFDGARHVETKKKTVSLISFSSQLCGQSTIDKTISTSSSFNILTWQQTKCDESRETVFPAVRDVYQEKKKLRDQQRDNQQLIDGTHLNFVDMHDGKMIYCLTGHVLWNRKHHPYILCKCGRGEGVRNNKTHECELITHADQVMYFERSKRRLNRKRGDVGEANYTDKQHMGWCDEHNYGITHFGIHPDELPRDSIAFDMFHMKCAITRSTMNYTRDFVLSQSTEFIDIFKTHLRRFWGEYHLFVWSCNKPFQSFHGNELAMWVKHIPATIALIRSHFDDNDHLKEMYQFLESWHSLPKFLGLTKIDEGTEWYKNKISEYIKNVTKLYDAGAKTVLTHNTVGDRETFYMHVLRYYVPQLAKRTYDKYGVGMGVYTMQGYERRNKESKNTFRRFNNNRGNVVVPNLKRLWDIFHHLINAY